MREFSYSKYDPHLPPPKGNQQLKWETLGVEVQKSFSCVVLGISCHYVNYHGISSVLPWDEQRQ